MALAILSLIRICNHRRKTLALVVEREDWDNEVLRVLRRSILSLAEPSWSPQGRYLSLTTTVPKVEEADLNLTVQTLLAQVASECKAAFNGDIKLANLERFVKSVYRLQARFGFNDTLMTDIFAMTVERVKGSVLLAKKVERVELVKSGARVDEKTMWPLNPGLRVKQPYGMILKTESGEVLSRAKAHCH
ncbi:hypothetical protein [Rubripirellula obstinata]|uniref:hypothetical protein n=1 Tax=Rubripirellula obstinata TaxID=406547 RepID=UPI0013587E33|nr:hypothetical protein [Rubripirellula obstinata]